MSISSKRLESNFLTTSAGARIFYRDFVPEGQELTIPLLCLPGFVRNSRDYIELGQILSASGTRLISPDLRGRGFSQRYSEAKDYHYDLLVQDVWDLLDHLQVRQVAVLGVALGGMIGMTMAASVPERARGIVLNDIGAEIGEGAVKQANTFADNAEYTLDEAVARVKEQFGEIYVGLAETRWHDLMLRAYRETSPGRYTRDFDLLVMADVARMRKESTQAQLWPQFLATRGTPVALLRGEYSDLLSSDVAAAMVREHGDTVLTTVKGRGHPPLLDEPESLAAIRTLLERATNRP